MKKTQFLILIIMLFFIGGAQATIIYQENFEDGSADGITVSRGIWTAQTTGLFGSNKGYHSSDQHNIFTLDGLLSNNVAIDADFKIGTQNGDFEIWVNATIDGSLDDRLESGYKIAVHPTDSDNSADVLARVDSGTGTVLDSHLDDQFVVGSENHLRLERFGNSLNVFLNGSLYLSATDSTYQNGSIGFRLFGDGVIDNIVVTPEPTSLLLFGLGGLVLRRKRRA